MSRENINIKVNTLNYLYVLMFLSNIYHIFKYIVSIIYEVLK